MSYFVSLRPLAYFMLFMVLAYRPVAGQGFPDDRIDEAGPDSFLVAFETSKGRFEAMVHRAWGPHASDRFYHLVRLDFFDEVSIYRVVNGFVAQFGIHNDREVNLAWRDLGVEDEATVHSNLRGTISFARGGPKSRTTQLFINLVDNVALDDLDYGGAVGYPPVAEIVSGLAVADSFNSQYGNAPSMRQDSINARGRAFLDRAFPGLDHIISARIVETYP